MNRLKLFRGILSGELFYFRVGRFFYSGRAGLFYFNSVIGDSILKNIGFFKGGALLVSGYALAASSASVHICPCWRADDEGGHFHLIIRESILSLR